MRLERVSEQKLKSELLNSEIFYTLEEARALIERLRHCDNTIGSHSSLGYPEARLVISGRGEDHKSLIKWFATIGLDSDRVEFEPNARNTFENAVFSHRRVQPAPEESWLLVTSAQHMPQERRVGRV